MQLSTPTCANPCLCFFVGGGALRPPTDPKPQTVLVYQFPFPYAFFRLFVLVGFGLGLESGSGGDVGWGR